MISFIILMSIIVCFSAIIALALNFQWGLGGMVNFGLTGLYALGAYACAILMTRFGMNTFVGAVGAMVIVAAVSALVALVTLRVSEEDYFAIVTLGVGEMLRLVALNEDWLTNGALGITGVPRPFGDVIPPEYYQYFMLGLSLTLLLGTLALLNVLARSPFGRIMRAVREDDVVAATLGKRVPWAHVRIFVLGGAVQANHCCRQWTGAGSRRCRRSSEARARREGDQFPGRRIDLRFHAEWRPAGPRDGPVDQQRRKERLRFLRKALTSRSSGRSAHRPIMRAVRTNRKRAVPMERPVALRPHAGAPA
jgi:Branched-chain amino acid transport system / permease component